MGKCLPLVVACVVRFRFLLSWLQLRRARIRGAAGVASRRPRPSPPRRGGTTRSGASRAAAPPLGARIDSKKGGATATAGWRPEEHRQAALRRPPTAAGWIPTPAGIRRKQGPCTNVEADSTAESGWGSVEAAPQARAGKSELPRTAWLIPGVLMRSKHELRSILDGARM